VAGSVHVLSGPDHVAAVAPLALDGNRRAWRTGFQWGLGHSTGVLLVGALSLMLREFLPLEALSSWAERLVGIVLVGVGLWGVRRALTGHLHFHEHQHEGQVQPHAHIHFHRSSEAHAASAAESSPANHHAHGHAAFLVGTLHGLAGSSQLLTVTAALAFATWSEAAAYLAAYGVGTILTMTLLSSAVGWLTTRFDLTRSLRPYRFLMMTCSTAALVLGVVWLAG